MAGPGPKLPRPEAPTIPASQQSYKPSIWDKLIEGAALGTGAYLAVRLIRYFDNGAPTDRGALNP